MRCIDFQRPPQKIAFSIANSSLDIAISMQMKGIKKFFATRKTCIKYLAEISGRVIFFIASAKEAGASFAFSAEIEREKRQSIMRNKSTES